MCDDGPKATYVIHDSKDFRIDSIMASIHLSRAIVIRDGLGTTERARRDYSALGHLYAHTYDAG